MDFDQDVDVRTDGFTHGPHSLDSNALLFSIDIRAPRAGKGIKLERREAPLDHLGGAFGDFL
jgi:hypothetical protein